MTETQLSSTKVAGCKRTRSNVTRDLRQMMMSCRVGSSQRRCKQAVPTAHFLRSYRSGYRWTGDGANSTRMPIMLYTAGIRDFHIALDALVRLAEQFNFIPIRSPRGKRSLKALEDNFLIGRTVEDFEWIVRIICYPSVATDGHA
jgi:hypothetical protein